MDNLKIQLCGPSGIGKTTLAKHISDIKGIPFVDGSYSTLVPSTKRIKHKDMLNRDPKEIYKEYIELVSQRTKAFNLDSYISDRSFLDVLVYTVDNLSSKLESCDIDFMNKLCKNMILESCSHLIFLEYPSRFISEIPIEDNNKRITNPYYQWKISGLFTYILKDLWKGYIHRSNDGSYRGELISDSEDRTVTKVSIIPYWDFNLRLKIIDNFLNS